MAPSSKQLSQKEYLKKYLNKKKKKKPRHGSRRGNVKLIDDDAVDLHDENPFNVEDDDDAPVIAGFYDERPTEVKLMENYRNADRWQPVPDVEKGNRRELREEDIRGRKRKHQQTHAISPPPRNKYRQDLSPLSRRTPLGEGRRVEERITHSPCRRGDRSRLEERRSLSDIESSFRDNEHSPWRTNRFNGGGDGDRDRHHREELLFEERHARVRHGSPPRSPPHRRRFEVDESRASLIRRGDLRPSPFAGERARGDRHASPPPFPRRKDRPDDRRHANGNRATAAAEHRPKNRRFPDMMSPPPPLLPPPSKHNRFNRGGDERTLSSSRGAGRHINMSPPPRGDHRLSPPRGGDRRLSPGPRANLDDRSRRRSFSPAPTRRYHSPVSAFEGRRPDRVEDRSRSRNERPPREPLSPIPVRKGGGRRFEKDASPPLPRRADPRREDRECRVRRDSRDLKDLRDPRDLRDLRDVRDLRDLPDPRDNRDSRVARDRRDVRDRGDLRDALRDVRDLRDVMRDPRDPIRDARNGREGREVVRTIEWKEKSSTVPRAAAVAPSRRVVDENPPPPQHSLPAWRDSPQQEPPSSSHSSRKRAKDKSASAAAVTSSSSLKKAAVNAAADERRRGGGGSGRRASPASPQSPPPPSSSKHRGGVPIRRDSRTPSPRHRIPAKFRNDSEQRFQQVPHNRHESIERDLLRGPRRDAGGRSLSPPTGPPKRIDESSSSKVAKMREREHEKGEKSARRKEEKYGLLSSKKSAPKIEGKVPDELPGKNAATVYRDAKTGKKRDLRAEKLDKIEKRRREEENKEQFYQWGRGLKQVAEEKAKAQEELYEMSKPLARYADDDDLDKSLRAKEMSGLDPMLEYMHRKKRKKESKDGKVTRPMYKGAWPPNRFNIPPGHRWDGVDRSNGYENRFFAKQNDRKAMEVEAYKWCSEDM